MARLILVRKLERVYFMTFKQALEDVRHEERPLASKIVIAIGNLATAPIVVPTSFVVSSRYRWIFGPQRK